MSAPHRKDSHTNYEQTGWKYKHEGEYKKAIDAFDKAIKYHQRTYFALHGKGECLLRTGDYDSALKCFESAINLDRRHPWAYHGAGRAYHFLKKYDTAIAYYEKSINIESHATVAWHWKGRTLIEIDEFEKAEKALSVALKNVVGSRHSKDLIPLIEADLKKAREGKEQMKKPESTAQIIIQGDNTAPINIDGIQGNDDSIINRAEVDNSVNRNYETINSGINNSKNNEKESFISKLFGNKKQVCSKCGEKIKDEQIFCSKCGAKLK
ncbi:MAG: tetratricopeptide repeat protein [Methanocorpusculum sp.]|nr:tetratricopeptide repeat protein [Methanocorpusculum sp.]